MASSIPRNGNGSGITKFTNCRLLKASEFIYEDLWISSKTGRILNGQEVFFTHRAAPERIVDLGGRIVSPGFIDVQLNGGFGFDFSVVPENESTYPEELRRMNKKLITTGVTSYLPTVTSQAPNVYQKVLHHLAPSGATRRPAKGSESLGAHIEGPFLSPTKNGIHSTSVLRSAPNGFSDLEACYGAHNFADPGSNGESSTVKLITLAPELQGMMGLIPELVSRGVTVSIGHSEASYEQGSTALAAGATMITHLFNAMRPLHHRNPGLFGLLGLAPEMPPIHQPAFFPMMSSPQGSCLTSPRNSPTSPLANTPPDSPTLGSEDEGNKERSAPASPELSQLPPSATGHFPARQAQHHATKPFFGLIADGVHLHPRTIALAAHAHGSGVILVTDAMPLAGLPDGTYSVGGSSILKKGTRLTLDSADERADRIAGSAVTLVECVNNFIDWAGVGVAKALSAVTEVPANLIGAEGVKGSLASGADADLVILDEIEGEAGRREVKVDQVWKFGECVFERA